MFAVTFVQCSPPSRVTCTSPSFVPAQMSPFSFGDSAIANTTPAYSTPMLSGVSPPESVCRALSFSVRSGLITCQLWPPFVVRCTYWMPAYTVLWSCGEMAIGNVQLKRYFRSPAGHADGRLRPDLDFARLPRALVEALDGAAEAAVAGAAGPDDVVVDRVGHGPSALAAGDRMPQAARNRPAGSSSDCFAIRLLLGPRVDGPSWRLP